MSGAPRRATPHTTEASPSRAQRDDAEWSNPANWHGGRLRLYHSRTDSRSLVPKPDDGIGFTINFARPGGVVFLVGIVLFAVLLVASAIGASR